VKSRRRWVRLVKWVSAAALAWLILVALLIIAYSRERSERPSDAAVVLGAAVYGHEPSPVFAARLDHGIDLHRRGIVRYLVLTGGVGEGDTTAESAVAATYAVARGVPAERILTEAVSRTTRQNLVEAKRLLREHGFSTCLLVSDPLHMRRASIMLADLGVDGESSPTPSSRYESFRRRSSPSCCANSTFTTTTCSSENKRSGRHVNGLRSSH
jgi:uncharacterized SAM-binding protein YcdF (DUF218 family)